MIPISLVIKGLYSYQETQKIVFDKLIEGQLFGIFGSVGSGKSSILEAISFALYGETERLNQRDNRNYNMMNLKSDELLIDFEFKNSGNENYRFTVRGKRNGKDFNKVNTFDRNAYKLIGGEWLPLENTSAESILGLSYDNFRRTIIIPQGKFQEFLQLGDKARTDMLKEIFHLNKYELFYQTSNLERKNNEDRQKLNGQLSHYEGINQEWISTKEIEVKVLLEKLNQHKIQLTEKDVLFQAKRNLKKIFDDRTACQLQLNALLTNEQHIKLLAQKVQDYEYCLLHFKDKIERKREIEVDLRKRKEALQDLNDSLDTCCKDIDLLNKEHEIIQFEYNKQDEYKSLIADYELILSLIILKSEKEKLSKRIEEGQIHIEQVVKDRLETENTLDKLNATRKSLKSTLPDMVVLANVRAWFDKKEHFTKSIQDLNNKLVNLTAGQIEVNQAINLQLAEPLLKDIRNGKLPDYHTSAVQELRKSFREQQTDILNQINHHRLQIKLGEFVQQLENGEPCMLCGSSHHPQILKVEDAQSHLKKANQEIEALIHIDNTLERILQDLFQLIQKEQNILQQIKDIQQSLDKEKSASLLHDQEFKWSGFSIHNRSFVNEAFDKAFNTQQKLEDIENEFARVEEEVKQKIVDYDRYSLAVNDLTLQLKGKESAYSTLEQQLRNFSSSDNLHINETDVKSKIEELNKAIRSVKERFEVLAEQGNELKNKKIILTERIASTNQFLLENNSLLKKTEDDLADCLKQSSYANLDDIQSILKQSFDITDLKKQISDYQQQLFAAKQQLKQLEELLAGQSFDAIEFEALETNLHELRSELDLINSTYIHEQALLIKAKNDLEKKIQLEKQLELLEHRAANINIFKQLFKGSGFVSYISTVYLQNLCNVANERFYKLTRQQLRLEVTDKNEFQVRDFLNNGKVRNVKTLSGGQTFQASLSLALALAESVQQQNKANQNFFFLDEGFGSLDKEALQIAFDTLKSLRKENRIVGIISHVEELQQEIDVFLNVKNDPFTGSKITGNWEK